MFSCKIVKFKTILLDNHCIYSILRNKCIKTRFNYYTQLCILFESIVNVVTTL